ncbi:glycoside hydrolase family 79 protein [Mycena sp. CBHHK59/15]|nr:glycoside hydrolase family 79 protein [Mycena sp. CBHHK59/15]
MTCTIVPYVLWSALAITRVLGIPVSIPLSPPSTAPALDGNLFSLSIEQDRWLDWAGNTSRNSFFFNTLDNLVELTGSNPTIRIGSESHHTNFNPGLQFVQQATTIVAGPGFFSAAQFFPTGTGVTWGVNFGGKNLTDVFLETQAIINAFSSQVFKAASITLDYLELGNEADLYKNNGLRPSNYSVSQYTNEWIIFATNMTRTANLANSDTEIWGAAFAGSSHTTTGFSPQGVFANGILDSEPGAFISTISQHHYSGSFCSGSGGLLQDLMTKATIRSNLSSFLPDIQATKDQGLDYVLGETNSYSCHGAPGVSNTAGAALWTRKFTIFHSFSQLGISRVYFHEGVGYKYNLIQPVVLTRSTLDGSTLAVPQQPHVQPQYYAAIVAAEAIGDSGQTTATELNINNTRGTNRTSTHLDLSFTGSGTKPTTFSVKRLVIGHADDVSGLTWGGQTYETSNARVGGTPTTEMGTVTAGLDIPATQALLIAFN